MDKQEALRQIPSIESLLEIAGSEAEFSVLSSAVLTKIFRHAAQTARREILAEGERTAGNAEYWRSRIMRLATNEKNQLLSSSLKRVINATGIILHTNLGRSPLSERARQGVNRVMEGYCALEYDLECGARSNRQIHIAGRIAAATGAEDALAVNNNAAAILLVLAGLTRGREVIVSRGELVEIGGSFRIPEVLEQSGAIMVEVGTTNKTRLADYANAITPNTAAILKVHTSNFRIVGFTEESDPADMCGLAHQQGILAINDLGSGTLYSLAKGAFREPSIAESVRAGFDVVTFSGDKLLGAGQAGIIAGRRRVLDTLRKNPLMRACRIDKMSLAALEGTLIDYAAGRHEESVPVWAMMTASPAALQLTAERLAEKLQEELEKALWQIRVVETQSLAGGGALPGETLPGFGVEVTPQETSAVKVGAALRKLPTPIIGLIRDAAIIFDVRCLFPDDENEICRGLKHIQQGV